MPLFNTSESAAQESFSGRRVLIVADDDADIDVLERVTDELGYGVKTATDGKTALIALDDFQPDLVITQLELSDMSAQELTSILRGAAHYASRFRHVPILFVAERNKSLKNRFVGVPEAPMTDYLFKPLDPNVVRERIERAFDKK